MIVDEFQEFFSINSAVYSELQGIWDRNRATCRLNVIFIGSVHSLMHRIFQDEKEPLFGRSDRIMYLKPFSLRSIYSVTSDYGYQDTQTLFDIYSITGGLPKYLELLAENDAITRDRMFDFIFRQFSPFLNEGKSLLIEEFGRDYGIYFSILELIASGKTARSEIESVLEIHTGAYLAKLEGEYALIDRHKPITAKPGGRLQKYYIRDNFLNFWFRFKSTVTCQRSKPVISPISGRSSDGITQPGPVVSSRSSSMSCLPKAADITGSVPIGNVATKMKSIW